MKKIIITAALMGIVSLSATLQAGGNDVQRAKAAILAECDIYNGSDLRNAYVTTSTDINGNTVYTFLSSPFGLYVTYGSAAVSSSGEIVWVSCGGIIS